MSLNPTKSIFSVTTRKLLSHIVSNHGININPKRVISIHNLPIPTSKNEIQSFMHNINFVRRFILYFAIMVKPIHNLLKQNQVFSWTDITKKDCVDIKTAISYALILLKHDLSKNLCTLMPLKKLSLQFFFRWMAT